jgi:glutathione S-transferase
VKFSFFLSPLHNSYQQLFKASFFNTREMPQQYQVGHPGPANERIGGVPTVHYFDFFSKGRGQVIRLLFIDAGIAYNDVRYSFDEYRNDIKPSFMQPGGMNPTGNVPVVELNGEVMTQFYAILRHFSRVLDNQYDGDTQEEMFWVDRMCDITIDWRTKLVDAYFSEKRKEEYESHCQMNRPRYMQALERHLTENEMAQRGPYVIGQKFTYADVVMSAPQLS